MAIAEAVIIHASGDVATVALLGARRQLPPHTAVLIGLILATSLPPSHP
jgi:hypothetical protein